jgi:hypothetical protein
MRVTEKCVLPALLIGRHGTEQLWPPPQPNTNLEIFYAMFPEQARMAAERDLYESFFDEARGTYSMRLKAAVTPPWRPAPPPEMSERDLILADQQKRIEESARHIAAGIERERGAERLRAEQAARADAHAAEQRRLAAGELPH